MNKSVFCLIVILCLTYGVQAQTHKTDVLVLGNGNAAWAAGMQSAISGVKTTILFSPAGFDIELRTQNLESGLAAQYRKRQQADSLLNQRALLKKWADSTANLQILSDRSYTKVSRSGSNWVVRLNNGQTLKAKVLIHAALEALPNVSPAKKITWLPLTFDNTLYRTSVASGDYLSSIKGNATVLPLSQLLVDDQENYVELKDLSNSMAAGQAGGALAAYAVFFKTKTSKANLKAIQGELLNFKQALMPLADVAPADADWRALQVIALMGTMPVQVSQGKALFQPEQPVALAEIKEPLQTLYYKTPIWYADHAHAPANLKNSISLICYLGNRSVTQITKEVNKKWEKPYQFNSPFAEETLLNRREIAVLLHEYLQPFEVNIDLTGRIIK
ncbi:hypothetical protein IWX76_001420 [Pedobacter sp. CAN_A7]|uniref:hypothetical protein n=1 Tax=Pedobacter sp. CAN_A7 TaxID=2787722 RepID=UPI0018CB30A0